MKKQKKTTKRIDGLTRVIFTLDEEAIGGLDLIANRWTQGNRSAAVRQLIGDRVEVELSNLRRREGRASRAR